MGVIDKVTDRISSLLPARRTSEESRQDLAPVGAEVLALRDNLDRWLQRFFEEPWGFSAVGGFQLMPSVNVQETDDQVVVTAEVPGLDPKDIDLTMTPEGLTIRGEKREHVENNRQDLHVSERRYGRFVRTIPLPGGVDPHRADARVEHGVLTVKFPKHAEQAAGRRVAISS
jgi:HSP20 family protein